MKMLRVVPAAACTVVLTAGPSALAQEGAQCPLHAQHQAEGRAHQDGVDRRHDEATGVSHAASVHHFTLYPDGGRILLEVKDEKDAAARDLVRAHLARVAREFGEGRFTLPETIHGKVPPGVAGMQRLKGSIRYAYAPTPDGGRVDITTSGTEARDAVHAFLRFQIEDHSTGDPTDVSAGR